MKLKTLYNMVLLYSSSGDVAVHFHTSGDVL